MKSVKNLLSAVSFISIPAIGFALGGIFGGLAGVSVDIALLSVTINLNW